jgi:hypothetical protein
MGGGRKKGESGENMVKTLGGWNGNQRKGYTVGWWGKQTWKEMCMEIQNGLRAVTVPVLV